MKEFLIHYQLRVRAEYAHQIKLLKITGDRTQEGEVGVSSRASSF